VFVEQAVKSLLTNIKGGGQVFLFAGTTILVILLAYNQT
jgi:hypothetical protein